MEFVDGEPLDRILRFRGPLDTDLALEITDQVAAGLSAAYRKGLVHRDIKPGNLMVIFGEKRKIVVKVIDFGLVKMFRLPDPTRKAGELDFFVGTPHFASPEQCAGKETDTRSDLYSLGITLWAMLSGKVPFEGSFSEILEKQQVEELPLEQLEHVPKAVVDLVRCLLAKDPVRRPQTPLELQTQIAAIKKDLASEQGNRKQRLTVKSGLDTLNTIKGFLALAIVAVLGLVIAWIFALKEKVPSVVEPRSVAVLPFDTVGNDKQSEYISDGLTSEVIYQLSKIADLHVIDRSSVLRYNRNQTDARKGLHEIGEELGVKAVLESTVQRDSEHLTVISVLYEARTGRRIWGADYDRHVTELFDIQKDLAEEIAAALHASLTEEEKGRIDKKPTDNPGAYELYLQGRALYELRNEDTNERAIECFKEAIQKDPRFSLAYAGLADGYVQRTFRFGGDASWLDAAIDLCKQGIALDPNEPRSYTALARAFYWKGQQEKIENLVQKALALQPNNLEATALLGDLLVSQRRFYEAYIEKRNCFAQSPRDNYAPYELAELSSSIGDPELADKWMMKTIELTEDNQKRQMLQAESLVFRHQYSAALEKLYQLPPTFMTYGTTAFFVSYSLQLRLGKWQALHDRVAQDLAVDPRDPWPVLYSALVEQHAGNSVQATQRVRQALILHQQVFLPGSPRWKDLALACCYRLLDQKKQAYSYLAAFFDAGDLIDLPLHESNPLLDLFQNDDEFIALAAEMAQRHAKARERIRSYEQQLTK